MKKPAIIIIALCILPLLANVYAENSFSPGFKIMVGGRYDNMRMCVATPANVKGGPIADMMFLANFALNEKNNLLLEVPIMRPILFGAAFKMVQFEPELTLIHAKSIDEKKSLIIGPGLGASFHYGPDYRSDSDNRGPDFFAAGPMVTWLTGLQFTTAKKSTRLVGLRIFYIPLFSSDSQLSPGTVFGAALEGDFIR